ncbi:hypothetical protein [Mucilaginibacter sp. OK098]|uniref:hypothetical protein n=1 Tax=Mucilaginibacter sp. OK098 TaxID=1855297 RepID=UPI00091BEB82|nr:hypothetical protein [Mucilaginibacter sp. OK098]SHL93302.1 hypothetical protein SAMN05216524_101225 [Mucilaginibacter sp. OK098]
MKNLFLIISIVLLGTISSSGYHKFLNPKIRHLSNNQTDDSDALQALLDKGGVINLPAGRSFTTAKTLYLKNNSEIVNGNMCIITYSGTDAAIDFQRTNKNFPVRNTISDLTIIVQSPNAVGIRWKSSYSSLKNCSIALKSSNQIGFELCGDVSGTGSYYNLFENCFVQGSRQLGKTNQYGWKFTYDATFPSRCANADLWIGGRVGQCDVGMYINGSGNEVNHVAAEGCGIAFYFDNPDSKAGCVSNKVIMPYIEKCSTAFKYGSNSIANIATSPYMTGVPSIKEDVGKNNVSN